MNQSAQPFAQNPWKSSEGVPAPTVLSVLLASLAFLLSALTLAFYPIEFVSYLSIAVCFCYTVFVGRVLRVTLPILLVGFFLVTTFVTPFLGATFLALTVGICALAFLFVSLPKPAHAASLGTLLCVAAFVISLVVTRNLFLALLTLSPLPASLAMAIAVRCNANRTVSVLATVGGLLFSLLALIAGLVYLNAGALTLDTLRSSVEFVREALVRELTAVGQETLAELEKSLAASPENQQAYDSILAQLREILSEDSIRSIVASLFNLLPALVTVLASLLAFFSRQLLTANLAFAKMERAITPQSLYLTASLPSAIFFLLAFFVQLLAGSNLVGVTAQNLFLILLPLFIAIGTRNLLLQARLLPGGSKMLWILIVLSLVCCSLPMVLTVIALMCASGRILGEIRAWRKQAAEQDSSDSNDDFQN